MEAITLAQLLEAVDGKLIGQFNDTGVTVDRVDTDSRKIHTGSLFIPLVGERFDGHAYIQSALEEGAAGCLTARERESYLPDKFYIKVNSTQKALRDLAAWYKNRFRIPFVAVTGSVGKTTAKDMIASVLGSRFKVLKTEGNFNNNVGLPLTLLRLNRSHQVCVLEMGMDRFGEIDYLGDIVKPEVAVITNIGDAHIERLGSREGIMQAKCEILPHIQPGGMLVLNGDDTMLSTLRGNTPVKTVFCGSGEGNQYRVTQTGGDGVSHIHCQVTTPVMDRNLKVPALGTHMIYPSVIGVAIGEHFGLSPDEIEEGILSFVPTRMRMNILHRGEGITVLDDTYNANPQSMRAAIKVLASAPAKHKVAVLGDMFELGSFAPVLHESVGDCVGKSDIHCLVAVGELSADLAKGARQSGVPEVHHCIDKEQAKKVLAGVIRPQTTFLVKASRGMALEELSRFLEENTPDCDG